MSFSNMDLGTRYGDTARTGARDRDNAARPGGGGAGATPAAAEQPQLGPERGRARRGRHAGSTEPRRVRRSSG